MSFMWAFPVHLTLNWQRKVACVWLMICLLPLAWAGQGTAKTTKTQQKLEQIQQRIEVLNQAVENSEEAKSDATLALQASEKAISEANRTLYELGQQFRLNQIKLKSMQSEQQQVQERLNQQKKLLASQLYQEYLYGTRNDLHVLLQNENPAAISRNLQYHSYLTKARAALIENMQQDLQHLSSLNASTSKTQQSLQDLKLVQEKQRMSLQKQKTQHAKLIQKISSQITMQRKEIDRLKRDEKNLATLVERLIRASTLNPKATRQKSSDKGQERLTEKSSPIRSEKSSETPVNASSGKVANDVADNAVPEAIDSGQYNFAALRGKLRLPARGSITHPFGSPREDSGLRWKGMFISADEGSEVKSVADGVIVFADWLRGFGNLMIIDHGQGYMSLYGNNQALLRKTGEAIRAGETIAYIGNSGGNSHPGLYYELRNQSKPFDPMAWTAAR